MSETTAKYINRELSWLEFNQRVLDEARNPDVPLDGFRHYINLLREIAGKEKLPE